MDDITLEAIIDLLKDVEEDVDYENCTALVDERFLDSFDILAIINAIDDEFDIAVPAKEVVPANFNSAQGIYEMVLRLAEEEEGTRQNSPGHFCLVVPVAPFLPIAK